MKTLTATIALALMGSTAMAQGYDCSLRDERGVRIAYSTAENAPTYAHGCDAMRYHDLSEAQTRQLLSSGNCSIKTVNGNGFTDDVTETEVEIPNPDYEAPKSHPRSTARHSNNGNNGNGHQGGNGNGGDVPETITVTVTTVTRSFPGEFGATNNEFGAFEGCDFPQVFASE